MEISENDIKFAKLFVKKGSNDSKSARILLKKKQYADSTYYFLFTRFNNLPNPTKV